MGFGAIAEAVAGLTSGVGQSIINYQQAQRQEYWNQANFDYQKALQQQIFEREDNAVQRRMADLKAAGLNPNLAAGSAANAGSVVGRASTGVKDINVGNPVGTMLDTLSAAQQVKMQRTQSEILNEEKRKAKYEADMAESDYQYNDLENVHNELALLYQLGLTNDTYLKVHNGRFSIHANDLEDGDYTINNTPLQNMLEWQWRNNKNAADMLQKDVDFYTADKIANYLGVGASIFSGAGSGFLNFNKAKDYNKRR